MPISAPPADADADSDSNPDSNSDPHSDADPDADAAPVQLQHGRISGARNIRVAANAIAAYNAGATGQGIKIGIVDSGINPDARRIRRPDRPGQRRRRRNRGVSDEGGHGTAVSAVAAAARNNCEHDGRRVRCDDHQRTRRSARVRCADHRSDGCSVLRQCDRRRDRRGAARRRQGDQPVARRLDPPGSQLLAAMQRAVNAGIVLVISAGNDGDDPTKGSNPDPFALDPGTEPSRAR